MQRRGARKFTQLRDLLDGNAAQQRVGLACHLRYYVHLSALLFFCPSPDAFPHLTSRAVDELAEQPSTEGFTGDKEI